MAKPTAPAEVFVLSEGCTMFFPDLNLGLAAGEVTCIPAEFLARVLSQPGVVQVNLANPEQE